ncbi:death-associated protein 1 homolog [Corticium candelabrum]|uniref:death-associated protein 1 homolog n=1 Tax=Corticium candelabrum TaxID=121492 RepID=UPI002E271453|nr:death-associated protein 1 homolog [Corticium candelabrum]
MSSPSSGQELKAGHPPAVKAGGMRITQTRHPQQSDVSPPMTAEEKEEFPEEKVETEAVVVAGYHTKGNKDFTEAAVKVAHNKPAPQHDKRPVAKGANRQTGVHIHQPRKN